jgi:type I restriction enzyme S subunit
MSNQWPTAKLGDVFKRVKDEVVVEDEKTYARLTIRMNGKGIVQRDRVPGHEIGTKKQFIARSGQLVLSKIDARNGAFGILPADCDNAIITGNFWAFDADHLRLLPGYFDYLTKTPLFVEFCIRASEGTTNRLYLQEDQFLAQEIALPPLEEQRRVVARIEELTAQIHEARTLRHQAAEEADALPLAELAAVFKRESSRVGVTALQSLIVDAGYGSSEKCEPERAPDSTPVLRIPNVAAERISLRDLKYARLNGRDRERLLLTEGDILVVRTNGSLELVGRSAVVPKLDEPFAFASYMIRLRVDSARVIPAYAQRMLQHLRVAGVLVDFARTSAGQYNVSLGRLRAAVIPVPPLPEQRRIVAELNALQVQVEALKRRQAETAAELDALMPAVLSRAFSGLL